MDKLALFSGKVREFHLSLQPEQRSFAPWAEDVPAIMSSTHKKVIVRKSDRDSISGFVAPSNFVVDGKLELLNTSGNVVAIDLRDIKAVYFVREFSDSDV